MIPGMRKNDKKDGVEGLIVTLGFEGAEIIDIAGPLDILCTAPCYLENGFDMSLRHESIVVSEFGGPITTLPSSITIHTERIDSITDKR